MRGLFLEALPRNARFVFVLRHPLAWALTIEKWLDNRWNFKKTLYLRDPDHGIDRRIDMWIQLVDKMLADVSSKDAAIVHAEACSLRPDVIPKSLARIVDGRRVSLTPFKGLARSNLAYVACWLEGGRTDAKAEVQGRTRRRAASTRACPERSLCATSRGRAPGPSSNPIYGAPRRID